MDFRSAHTEVKDHLLATKRPRIIIPDAPEPITWQQAHKYAAKYLGLKKYKVKKKL